MITVQELIDSEKFKPRLDKAVETVLQSNFIEEENDVHYITPYWDYHDEDDLRENLVEILGSGTFYYDPDNHRWTKAFNDAYDEVYLDRPGLIQTSAHGEIDIRYAVLDILEQQARRSWADTAELHHMNDLISQIIEELNDDFSDIDDDSYDWCEALRDEYNIQFDTGIDKHLDDLEINANIIFNTADEWNAEFTNIPTMFALMEDDEINDYIFENNSLTWLMQTQDFTWFDLCNNKKRSESAFLKSVMQEALNNPSFMSTLTLCAKMTFKAYCDLISGKPFEVNPNNTCFTMGFFDEFYGGGSCLELAPEKPFVIDTEHIYKIQVESKRNKDNRHYYNWTVNEVYELIDQCWSNCLTPVDHPNSA